MKHDLYRHDDDTYALQYLLLLHVVACLAGVPVLVLLLTGSQHST